MTGKLFIVPTPIGNMEDITLRALRVLKEADGILAEDTRHSAVLLEHFQIRKPMQSYHAFNEHSITEKITERIRQGAKLALVSDAGTPGISDPGFLIIRRCIEKNIPVECLPGPTAFLPALIMSGFPTDRFVFEGFLPHKKGRQTRLKQLAAEDRTVVLYESPHRIEKTLKQMLGYFDPQRQVCICRELTKKFEHIIRGTLQDIVTDLSSYPLLGEMVLVIAGKK